jgi:predicted nucleic acid-binding Zn ribbon protein
LREHVSGSQKPTRLGDALQSYLRESGLDERVEEATILPEWDERVGAAIAAVTQPVRVSRGTLLIAVRTSGWLMELRLMEREILRRINEGRERGRISRIRFVITGDEDAPEEPQRRGRGRRGGRSRDG